MKLSYDMATKHIQAIRQSEGCSYWLKNTLESALDRDCVKALHEVDLIAAILRTRVEYIQGKES